MATRNSSRATLYCFAAVVVCGIAIWRGEVSRRFLLIPPNRNQNLETEIDQALQRAAENALGQQEGTIIVADPQTGRVRAVVNPRIAFGNSYAPGSTIKPFTALAALRAGLIDKNSNTVCREHYSRKDFHTVCAHPRDLPPFNPSEAIAYSCNYYFGTLGERLSEASLSDTLSSFGFGRPTTINEGQDQAGKLLRGKSDPRNALGEGDHLQATPIQLIMAYSALVNGGRLLAPRVGPTSDVQVSTRAQLEIATEHRSLVIEGMRGAVVYGTAAHAGLNSSSLNVFGKTGTSTPAKGFRTQGWFVGFAAAGNENLPAPKDIQLAVLVFLKRAHGANAAALSRGIFDAYERTMTDTETGGQKDAETRGQKDMGIGGHGDAGMSGESSILRGTKLVTRNIPVSPRLPFPVSGSPRLPVSPSPLLSVPVSPRLPFPVSSSTRLRVPVSVIRVHLVRENITRDIPLENYVANVVATEGSMEDQPEALKALAVTVRTYALKNLGRHVKDGYDFCTTTHCQRYQAASDPTLAAVSGPQAASNARALAAVQATSLEVLRDERSSLVESYFSASCGGMTANAQTLWGGNAPSYLRGVRDEYCGGMPHHSWTDVIPAEQLLQALRSSERTDPGLVLKGLTIARRDATGRAELITIEGQQRHTVRGWDFKIIVGRKLGWNRLKSSRFEVTRSGSDFVFRGSGFGHGLGLCQEGAHVMAQRGASYEQILAKYFPGTTVARGVDNRVVTSQSTDENDHLAAWPPHSAVRLCLTGHLLSCSGEATPRIRGVASNSNEFIPEGHSLSALCGGKAANAYNQLRTFADLLWNTETRYSRPQATNPPASESGIAASLHNYSTKRTTLSSEHFRVSYPVTVLQRDAEGVLRTLETARANLRQRVSAAGLSLNQFPAPEVFINATTGDFVGRTGQPWWAAAATKGDLIELQPIEVLKRRGVLDTTLRHELIHTLIDELSRGRAPRWLAEGMALYFAGEGPMVSRYKSTGKITVLEIDERLATASTADEMRQAYAAAYREVSGLIRTSGEAGVWQRIATGFPSP